MNETGKTTPEAPQLDKTAAQAEHDALAARMQSDNPPSQAEIEANRNKFVALSSTGEQVPVATIGASPLPAVEREREKFITEQVVDPGIAQPLFESQNH